MTGPDAAGLQVAVTAVPDVALIRPAIEATLAGRPFPAGPEADIARAVADALQNRGPTC